MINYPEYVKVDDRKYKLNTSYQVALKCQEVAESDVSDEERALAIIYLLYGEQGLNRNEDWNGLLSIGLKYLNCNKEINTDKKEEANMDLKQDWGYIQASFFSDYNIDLQKTQMHWWQFYDLLCGLTEKCVLNRVRFVRDFDISQIKDGKERQKWIEQKSQVALKKKEEKTSEEIRLDELFEKQMKGE